MEQYQKSRVQFVQTVAELASRPQNVELLQNAGVMSLLRPLLLDTVPSIQQTALGRLANYNDNLAEAVVKGDILPQLVYSLSEQNVNIFSSNLSFGLIHCSYRGSLSQSSVSSCNRVEISQSMLTSVMQF